ncbi:hypothetical protein MTR67_002975 [Solanum verrucosum]|uniref:Receptor ligand binding region domain-containing protein n=1 Tax=Solanum verrucosum TaxID=315347 RepID=A0AAF0PTG3_SOLVR|nr:hypothetical protein MTR67_002975 [Solanum verrucosum]
MNMQTRVFIVHIPISLGSNLFAMAKEIGIMSEGFVWIVTDAMADQLNLMEGVIGMKPYVPKSEKVKDFIQRWKMKFLEENLRIVDVELDVYGLWVQAYVYALEFPLHARTFHVLSHLAMMQKQFLAFVCLSSLPLVASQDEGSLGEQQWFLSADHVQRVGFGRDKLCIRAQSSSVLGYMYSGSSTGVSLRSCDIPVSFGEPAYIPEDFTFILHLPLEASQDKGSLGDQQWFPSADYVQGVGSGNATDLEAFGVSRDGPKRLQAILNTTFKGLRGNFQFIDGQLQSPPYPIINVIGWVIPTNGKKLRIGVPVKDNFTKFVKVTRDLTTNTTIATGYCINVFDAVMEALPYYFPYEYVPFAAPNGKSAGDYNELIYQAFPIGSPLVPDVSRAVLNVTEGEKMVQIERAWFGESTCSDSSTSLSSNRLGLDSFWGFFVMAVIAAVLALIIFLTKFVHEHLHIIRRSNLSLRKISRILARNFDTKDYSSNTFKKSELRDVLADSTHHLDCLRSPHDQIKSELLKLMNMQARLFIVHMLISLGSKLFATAKEIGMMSEGFVWIVTDAMANQLNLMDV